MTVTLFRLGRPLPEVPSQTDLSGGHRGHRPIHGLRRVGQVQEHVAAADQFQVVEGTLQVREYDADLRSQCRILVEQLKVDPHGFQRARNPAAGEVERVGVGNLSERETMRFTMHDPGRIVARLFDRCAEHGRNQNRAEVGTNGQRQIVAQPGVQSNTCIESMHQLVVEHLLRIVEGLAVRIRLKPSVARKRIGRDQRRPLNRLPVQGVPIECICLHLALGKRLAEMVQNLSKTCVHCLISGFPGSISSQNIAILPGNRGTITYSFLGPGLFFFNVLPSVFSALTTKCFSPNGRSKSGKATQFLT